MAKKKRSARCKNVRVNGKLRKMCWGKNGKITSNKAVRR